MKMISFAQVLEPETKNEPSNTLCFADTIQKVQEFEAPPGFLSTILVSIVITNQGCMTIPGTSPQAFPSLNKYCTQGGGQGKQAAACSMGGGWVQVLHLFSMVGMVAVILTDMAQLTVGQGMLEMCRDVSTPECHLANGACVPMGRQDDDVAIIDLFDCLQGNRNTKRTERGTT
eukprot:1157621-Pelagomonas_calceolata.AAC.1